ncbi:MAG: helix-turn-helix domain-containing protein [Candidatus Doudnabacteria bacterium]|nr:helix-turn-helix domain-containing protein [Candidatus Doudnabacteria bacterium]
MINNQLLGKLIDIGLDEKEAVLYAAGLELGESSIQELAKESHIKRPTAYRVMEELETKGLFSKVSKGKKYYYEAEDPETIFGLYKTRQDAFARLLPDLKQLHGKDGKVPKVRFFRGMEGLKSMYLESLNAKETIVGYGSIDEIWGLSKEFINDYMKERIKRKIRVRGIVPSTSESQAFAKLNESQMRELVLVPKERFPLGNEINIYDDKVAVFSFKEMVGIIIESKDIAHTQKVVFELAWTGAHLM